jgi:hypothetical protein
MLEFRLQICRDQFLDYFFFFNKVRKWGPFRHFSHMAFCTLTPKEFLHSSLEALHAERRQRPQLAKEVTMNEFCWKSCNHIDC